MRDLPDPRFASATGMPRDRSRCATKFSKLRNTLLKILQLQLMLMLMWAC